MFFPLSVLIGGVVWLGLQDRRMATLEGESAVLREAIEAARRSDAKATEPTATAGFESLTGLPREGKIDWKKVLERKRRQTGDIAKVRLAVEITKRLDGMSAEEIAAEFDAIAASGFPDDERWQVESVVLGELMRRDPAMMMDRIVGRFDDAWLRPLADEAFGRWVEKDRAAVIAWMDRQIAAGTLGRKSLLGTSSALLRFEQTLFPVLIGSDPAAAIGRLKNLSEDQRTEAFRAMLPGMKPGMEKTWVEAIRATVSGENYDAAMETAASCISSQGLDRMSEVLRSLNGSEEERAAMVAGVIRMPQVPQTGNNSEVKQYLYELLEWGSREAPGKIDDIALENLHNPRRGDFSTRAEVAARYAAEKGSDEVLVGFLHSPEVLNYPETALPLIEKIANPETREKLKSWVESAPGHGTH